MKEVHDSVACAAHADYMGQAKGYSRVCTRGPTPAPEAVALLRSQIHQAHLLLDAQVLETWERAPFAHAEALSLYVHALCVEDATVNSLLREMPPLFKSVWIGGQLAPWDLTSVRCYAQVVYAATDALVARLTSEDLRRQLDLSEVGLGWPDTSWVVNRFIVFQIARTCGELEATARGDPRRSSLGSLPSSVDAVPSVDGRSNGIHRSPRRNGAAEAGPTRDHLAPATRSALP
jgi:hypothetical protein